MVLPRKDPRLLCERRRRKIDNRGNDSLNWPLQILSPF